MIRSTFTRNAFLRMIRYLFPLLFISSTVSSQEIKSINPTESGYKASFFQKTGEHALKEIPSLGSMLVWKDSGLVYESYFNGATASTLFQLKSVTKTVTSALAGIAHDKGLLPDLQTPVLDLFPEYDTDITSNENVWYPQLMKETDSLKHTLTLHNLLTMQAGFEWEDNSNLSHRAFQTSSDPVKFVLELPYSSIPGTTFNYCTGASHVIGAVISTCVKTDLDTFADSVLFEPLGIQVTKWTCDPKGMLAGGAELSMKANDLLKFGLLFLNKGRSGEQQLISESWVNESTIEQAELNEWDVLPGANGYGYYWWRRMTNGHQAIVASGYGGQIIFIVPDLKLIVVTTCLVNEQNRGRSEIKRLHTIIDRIVKASIR